jgi:hypothetical protein
MVVNVDAVIRVVHIFFCFYYKFKYKYKNNKLRLFFEVKAIGFYGLNSSFGEQFDSMAVPRLVL